MEQVWIDCSKGSANCCKDNLVELTVDEFKALYDKAPIVIMIKAFLQDRFKPDASFFKKENFYFYLNFAMLANPSCLFLENNKCSIYSNRPGMCRIFPIIGYDKESKTAAIREDFCESCGSGCVNNDGEGFLLADNNKLSEILESEAKKIIQNIDKSRLIFKIKVFERLVSFMKIRFPKDLKDIVIQAAILNAQGQDLWISPIDPKIFPIIKKFLITEGLTPSVFLDRQLKFMTSVRTS